LTPEVFIKAQLAARAHRDGSQHGGTDNMLAVAFVMRTRFRDGWGDWMKILGDADRVAGTLYPPTIPNVRDIAFRVILNGIDDVFTGLAIDKMTEGALFYCELNNCQPWFVEKIVRDPETHPRVATIGPVSFFR
jgi:hypothetical protein